MYDGGLLYGLQDKMENCNLILLISVVSSCFLLYADWVLIY